MTKPVALADQTYRRLKLRKRPGESFSDVIERLLAERKDPRLFPARVPKSREPARRRIEAIERDREESWEQA